MRGEYHLHAGVRFSSAELPPHARRIPIEGFIPGAGIGTTSACAENTMAWMLMVYSPRNYLRMRGEYGDWGYGSLTTLELPPHARRIPRNAAITSSHAGTTSACAENTVTRLTSVVVPGNYLRMRGEYLDDCTEFWEAWELPPHARRILLAAGLGLAGGGTTSACAENTLNELGLL